MYFKNIGVFGKFGKQDIGDTLLKINDILLDLGTKVFFDNFTSENYPSLKLPNKKIKDLGKDCDLIISVGGDGTFLNVARTMSQYNKPMLGVNLGRLGFLTDFTPDENMSNSLADILNGKYTVKARSLLQSKLIRNGKIINRFISLNEVVIQKKDPARLIEFTTEIDGHFVNSQRSDGVIIATPTGSTAYSLSGGGPILEPNIKAVSIVPICPHTLTSRPIVVDEKSQIKICLLDSNTSQAQVTCDGHNYHDMEIGDELRIQKHRDSVKIIHSKSYEPYTTWREKLNWNK